MESNILVDLVPLFEGLITELEPYANQQDVRLSFKSSVENLQIFYNPEVIIAQFSNVIRRVIAYTPKSNKVSVSFEEDKEKGVVLIRISNTGVDLRRIHEITNSLSYKLEVNGVKNKGTIFKIDLPINKVNIYDKDNKANNLGYTPYYIEIGKRLSTYFTEIDNLQKAAESKNSKSGAFLRKVNVIIQSRFEDHNFKVDALASAMALSRAQLFRKMKLLTQMSPSQYILFFRLHVARELLETKRNEFNVSEVCYRAGFVSMSHFSRSFQKQFGFTPSNYKINKMQL